jgi:hypothetical protein
MAEFLYSGAGDLRLTEAMAGMYRLILADRFSLLGHPSVTYIGNCASRGSTVFKVPFAGLQGYDRMSAVAENASTAPTSVTDTSATVTVARQAIERSISDLNDMVDSVGVNVEALIADGVGAYSMRWMEMLCNLLDNFSSTAGTTAVACSADGWFTSKFTLQQNSVPGPYLAVLYPTSRTNLENSIRAEGGPWQYKSDVQDIFTARGFGVVGQIDGIDIVQSSLVPTMNAGVDSGNAMFGAGAIGWANGTPRSFRGGNEVVFPAGQQMYTELERNASGALTKAVHNAFLGFTELEDLKGVTWVGAR